MINLNCQYCEGEFDVPPSRKDTAHFCSKVCYYKSKEVSKDQQRISRNSRRRELEEERKLNGSCPKCGKDKDDEFVHCSVCRNKYKLQPSRNSEKTKRYQRRARVDCLNHYGRQCNCCGESVEMFLEFDHIDNNGAEHRKVDKIRSLPVWLKRNGFPEGFHVLCRNCNWGKHINDGVCPHQIRGYNDRRARRFDANRSL